MAFFENPHKLRPEQKQLRETLQPRVNAIVIEAPRMGVTSAMIVAAAAYPRVIWLSHPGWRPIEHEIYQKFAPGRFKRLLVVERRAQVLECRDFERHVMITPFLLVDPSVRRVLLSSKNSWDLMVARDGGSLHSTRTQITRLVFRRPPLSDRLWIHHWRDATATPMELFFPAHRMLDREMLRDKGVWSMQQWQQRFTFGKMQGGGHGGRAYWKEEGHQHLDLLAELITPLCIKVPSLPPLVALARASDLKD